MTSLKQKTIQGVAWNTVGKISNQILQFILSIILMRLLLPTDYGLLAMAMVIIGLADIFSEFGFSSALIQNQNITEFHKSSVFWLNIIIGSLFTTIFLFYSDGIANLYDSQNLNIVIQYLSFSFIISSVAIVPNALLQKGMRYDIINKIEVVAVLLSGTLSVLLAYNGWGVMSLVFQILFSYLIKTPLLLIFSGWKPRLIFKKDSIKELFSFSAYLTGFNFINYFARKSDDLLVGKFMGAQSLGIYSRAYNLMLFPVSRVVSLVRNVMFPALSSIQDDKKRVKRIFLDVIQVLAFITFPVMIGMIAVADNFIIVLFGEKWAEVIPIIRILAFVGVFQTLGNPTGWIFTSQGKTNWLFWWGVFGSGSIVFAIIIGVIIGSIYSVAIAYLVINIILAYPVMAIPGKLIDMTYIEVLKRIYPILIISILMALIIYFAGGLLPNSFSIVIKLIVQVFLGLIIYFGLMWYFRIDSFLSFKKLIGEQFILLKNKTQKNK